MDAASSPPLATITILSDGPVSCSPRFDLQYDAGKFIYLNEESSKFIKFKGLVKKSNNLHNMTFLCFTQKEKVKQDDVYFQTLRTNSVTGIIFSKL